MVMQSMTGYGSAVRCFGDVEYSVEIRSVNHRFLDISIRLPAALQCLEQELTRDLRRELKRGRVEVFVNRREQVDKPVELIFHRNVFQSYLEKAREALSLAGAAAESDLSQFALGLLQRREVLEVGGKEEDAGNESAMVRETLGEALAGLVRMRENEGAALAREILGYLDQLDNLRLRLAELSGSSAERFRERLSARLERLAPELSVSEDRLAAEVALLAERTDFTEEIVRLASHIEQFRDVVARAEGGRKMDFLVQEMMREINTTGSKAQSGEIASLVVEAKTNVEKIREQIQNIE